MTHLKACKVHCQKCLQDMSDLGYKYAGVHAISSLARHALKLPRDLADYARRRNLPITLVLLTKSHSIDDICNAIEYTGINYLQLHSVWAPQDIAVLRERLGENGNVKLIALVPPSDQIVEQAERMLEEADYLIVDHPQGGTGQPVDSNALDALAEAIGMDRVFVSGGLNPENVHDVTSRYSPHCVDAQSSLLRTDGSQSYMELRRFSLASRGSLSTSVSFTQNLPFERYSSALWSGLDPQILTEEEVVAKMNLLDALEARSRYRNTTLPIWTRIEQSVNQLERLSTDVRPEWLEAAVILYANTYYLPEEMLDQAWRSLYIDIAGYLTRAGGTQSLADVHIFENDPSGMTSRFCHVNGIQGRLDTQTMGRIDGTDKLADYLLGLGNTSTRDLYLSTLQRLLEKKSWILLVDKTLSGHSLRGDVERLLAFAKMGEDAGYALPTIWILAQVSTQQALDSIRDLTEALTPRLHVRSAISLDASHSLSTPGSKLIKSSRVKHAARELCLWFAENVMLGDSLLNRMRERSGDLLEFGYRNCGLTVVDNSNCPTDSLPLFWYSDTAEGFTGPYPRVHSRIGDQVEEQSHDKWTDILNDDSIASALRLANVT